MPAVPEGGMLEYSRFPSRPAAASPMGSEFRKGLIDGQLEGNRFGPNGAMAFRCSDAVTPLTACPDPKAQTADLHLSGAAPTRSPVLAWTLYSRHQMARGIPLPAVIQLKPWSTPFSLPAWTIC